jgi:large subunit ribosomal protein L32e
MAGEDERKRLMKLRKRMSQRRPKFAQFESWRYVRIKDHWRQPKGIDNHMRQNRKGWPRSVNVGYRSPKAVRGLHPSGVEEVVVFNVGDLAIVDPETQVARIGGSVGVKKRTGILQEAERQGIRVLNPGKAWPILEEAEEDFEEAEEDIEEPEAEEEIGEPEPEEGIEATDEEPEGIDEEPDEPEKEGEDSQ